ncbi:MFS transporter [Actinokineospora globicatena]|uniref:MFS transporter n=1 Tax=Actinokineospora globicatena TaxID=103729 RepID=UPI0020A405CC|nr:MFS transporter [Actinokineospora globicatena]MCP2302471.1 putative arabinose efflux permease, MFS family [Actinokineospora globicatena]GLW75845.1 MFS transporter [Actinokineospora globicatena]GLW82683.1 MFS transporter [Actinokineospora globicatena]
MATPVTTTETSRTRLWTSNFALYFVARIVSMLGDMMIPVSMSVAVLGLGYGVTGVGLALGAWMGAFALFVVFGGVFADRFHPLPQMIGADAVRCALQSALAVYLWLGHPPLWFIVLASLLGGVATAMFQPGLTSMVPQVASDPHQANGVLRVSQGLATMLGPALAGVLVASFSVGWAFAVDAATFAISGICLLLLKIPRFEVDRSESTLQNLKSGWQEFRSRSWLWAVILIWWVLGVTVWGPIHPLGAASIIGEHGKAVFGYAEAAFGAGSILGGLVAIKLRPARPLFGGGIAMFLFPLMPLGAALVPSVPLLLLLYAISGIGWAFWGVQWATTVQTQIPEDKLNRVAAYEIAGSILAVPLGQVLAGPASALFGVHQLLFVATIAGLGCAVALLATAPIRRLRRVPG